MTAPAEGWTEPQAYAAEAEAWKDGFYAMCERQLAFLQEKFGDFRPRMGVVLGSGMGGLAYNHEFKQVGQLEFKDIPGMTKPSTGGHTGILHWGTIRGLDALLFGGRVQLTDFSQWNTTPARAARLATANLTVAKGLGVEAFVLTSAAGIAHAHGETWRRFIHRLPDVRKGDVVAIADYTNFTPLAGPLLAPYDERLGQRFNGKGNFIDLRMLRYVMDSLGKHCHVGSYAQSPSMPNFEGILDLLRIGATESVIRSSPESVIVAGMSLAAELDTLILHNPKPFDKYGFDRRVRILALSLGTNDINPPRLPTGGEYFSGNIC